MDEVLVYQPVATFPASDMKQFYVSVSRGRYGVHIYTDDKVTMLEQVSKSRDRLSAIEMIKSNQTKEMVSNERLKTQKPLLPAIGYKIGLLY
ncbi:MAG: hypothetical protein WDO71_17865 [Bacteroidota bacterium]